VQKNNKFLGVLNFEELISMVLGLIIVLTAVFLLFNFFRKQFSGSVTVPGLNTIVNRETGVVTTSEGEKKIEEKQIENGNYIVQKGDSLWKLAQINLGSGDKYVEIAKLNGLAINTRLEIGQSLKLPQKSVVAGAKIAPDSEQKITANEYVIQKGDSLANVALRAYGDSFAWVRIWKANEKVVGKNPTLIFSGTKIVIPR